MLKSLAQKLSTTSIKMSKSRTWCFTINNYVDADIQNISHVACSYLIYGKEVGEEGKTPHLQGYVEFENARAMGGVKKAFKNKTMHLEPRRGTAAQASEYCKKDGAFIEYGQISQQGKRSDLIEVAEIMKNRGLAALTEERPEMIIKYSKGILALQTFLLKPRTQKPRVVWLWGLAGTGKTRTATDGLPATDVYIQTFDKWWDGYQQQKRIVLDDYTWDGKDVSFRYLLRLLDRYACQVEVKGGTVHINSPEIYITCEFPPSTFWMGNMLTQVTRRLDEIREVKMGDYVEVPAPEVPHVNTPEDDEFELYLNEPYIPNAHDADKVTEIAKEVLEPEIILPAIDNVMSPTEIVSNTPSTPKGWW